VSIGLFFPETGDIFLRNVGLFSADYTVLYPWKAELCLLDCLPQKPGAIFDSYFEHFLAGSNAVIWRQLNNFEGHIEYIFKAEE
jgi:hypothetical protein